MALGVGGNADVPQPMIEFGDVAQQLQGGCVLSQRLWRVAARDENAVHARITEPAHYFPQVVVVAHHLCGNVRHHTKAACDQVFAEIQGHIDATGRRTGDRHVAAGFEDIEPLLDARARENLHVGRMHGTRQSLAFHVRQRGLRWLGHPTS